jgi:hypothetical protein
MGMGGMGMGGMGGMGMGGMGMGGMGGMGMGGMGMGGMGGMGMGGMGMGGMGGMPMDGGMNMDGGGECGSSTDRYMANLTKSGHDGKFSVVLQSSSPAPDGPGSEDWMILVKDSGGSSVSGATLDVTPFMPAMGHGTPIAVVATDQGGGMYDLNPVNLFMPGEWQVTIGISKGGTTDQVVFSFCIPGGMNMDGGMGGMGGMNMGGMGGMNMGGMGGMGGMNMDGGMGGMNMDGGMGGMNMGHRDGGMDAAMSMDGMAP